MAHSPPPRPRAPRRRWLLLFLPLSLVLLAWFAPWIIARTPLREGLAGAAAGSLPFRVKIGSASLDWLSPVELGQVRILDSAGQPLAEIGRLHCDRTLAQLLLDRTNLGTVRLEQGAAHVVLHEQGSNWETALAPLLAEPAAGPMPHLRVELVEGFVEIVDAPKRLKWEVDNISGELAAGADAPLAGRLQWFIASRSPERPPDGSLRFRLPRAGGAEAAPPEPGEAVVLLDGLPLSLVEPLLRRARPGLALQGLAQGDFTLRWLGERADLDIRRLEVHQFLVHSPEHTGEEPLHLQHARALGGLSYDSGRATARGLVVETDLGHADFSGAVAFSELSALGAPAGLLRQFAAGNAALKGELQLAALAARFPAALRLRPGAQIESGTVRWNLASVPGAEPSAPRRLTLEAEAAGLAGTVEGRRVAWEEPLALQGTFALHGDGSSLAHLRVEEMIGRSDFGELRAAGTAESGRANLRADLSRLRARLAEFVDLGDWALAGAIEGEFAWQPAEGGRIGAESRWTLNGLKMELPGHPAWHEPAAELRGTAEFTPLTTGILLHTAEGTAQLSGDTAQWRLNGPYPLGGALPEPPPPAQLQAKLTGDLARWNARLVALSSDHGARPTGAGTVELAASLAPEEIQVSQLRAEFNNFNLDYGELQVHEPRVELVANGRWRPAARQLQIPSLTVTGAAAAARGEQLVIPLNGGAPPAGELALRADLPRLLAWWRGAPEAIPYQVYGTLVANSRITPSDGRLLAEWQGGVENLVVAERPAPAGGIQPVSAAIGPPRPIWHEARLHTGGTLTYTPEGPSWHLAQARAGGAAWSLQATGDIAANERAECNLTGVLAYDLAALAAQLRPILGKEIELTGRRDAPFQLRGPLRAPRLTAGAVAPNGPSIPTELAGGVRLGLEGGRVYGLNLGRAEGEVTLAGSVVSVGPVPLPLNQGELWLGPQFDFRTQTPMVLLPVGTWVNNVDLTPELCHGWLRLVAPLLAESTRAQGRFSLTLADSRLPLADPAAGATTGAIAIHEGRVGPGPLAEQFLAVAATVKGIIDRQPPRALNRDTEWLTLPPQEIAFQLRDRRMHHQGLMLAVGDVLIRTHGSVGVDDESLQMIAEVPIRDQWVEKERLLAGMRGRSLQLPITGTLRQPRVDGRVLDQLGRTLLQGAAGGLIDDALQRGLQRGLQEIFGPRP